MPTATKNRNTTIRSETLENHDERGNAIKTVITIRVNPTWTEATADTEWFYLCQSVETGHDGQSETVDEALHDEADDAHAWVDAMVAETEERYAGLEDDRRETLADALAVMAGDEAIPGSAEAKLLAAVARAIKSGKAADLLARLK